MKKTIAFYELDSKMAESMHSFITLEFERLLKMYPNIIRLNPSQINADNNEVDLKLADGSVIQLTFFYRVVDDEKQAIKQSILLKDKNESDYLLSVINYGSNHYKKCLKGNLNSLDLLYGDSCDMKLDDIINCLEGRNIGLLLTPWVTDFNCTDQTYFISRAQRDNALDNNWHASCANRHSDFVKANKDDVDENLYLIVSELLGSAYLNRQFLGEIIYKAILPSLWDMKKTQQKMIEK